MKRIMLALFLGILATTAHAGGGKATFLNCGLKVAGASLEFNENTDARGKHRDKESQAVKSIEAQTFASNPYSQIKSGNTRRRLPAAFTVARVECSWL